MSAPGCRCLKTLLTVVIRSRVSSFMVYESNFPPNHAPCSPRSSQSPTVLSQGFASLSSPAPLSWDDLTSGIGHSAFLVDGMYMTFRTLLRTHLFPIVFVSCFSYCCTFSFSSLYYRTVNHQAPSTDQLNVEDLVITLSQLSVDVEHLFLNLAWSQSSAT